MTRSPAPAATVPKIKLGCGTGLTVGTETYIGCSMGCSAKEIGGISTVGGDCGVFGNPPPARVTTGDTGATGGPITTTGLFQGGLLDDV